MSQKSDLKEAFDKEQLVKRNPHTDFPAVQASRPDYDVSQAWVPSKTPNPEWQPGDGALCSDERCHKMVDIDPNSPDRTINQNYKFMISSTVPRPIALVSTVSLDGSLRNLAPFSYFNNVANDPPIYSLAFHGEEANDSLRNLLETKELCISIVSEWFLEAANFTSINTPPEISEWELSGLSARRSKIVRPLYVNEAAVSIECKLHSFQTIYSKTLVDSEGNPRRSATLALLEAVMFHVTEDAIDSKRETVDISVLRPVWRGGGITYGSCFRGWETPRPEAFRVLKDTKRVKDLLVKNNSNSHLLTQGDYLLNIE
jgi:flavin reductase (DIM6/NTAB) family NADH-FMN oxidoreductase RutF